MEFRVILSLVFCAFCSGKIIADSAATPPSVVVLELPGLTDKSGEGAYANLYNALQKKGLIENWHSAPSKRAHSQFLKKETGCIAPASLDLLDRYKVPRSDFSISIPFNRVLGQLMFAAVPPTPKSEKPILGVVGFGVQHGVEPGIFRVEAVPVYNRLLNLVSENRIDAAYIVYPDILHHDGSIALINEFKGKVETRWEGIDGVLCWKQHEEIVLQMSTSLNAWRRNGRLKYLLGKYFVE